MMPSWPPKRSFEPPRYPNVWFLVSAQLVDSYSDAASFVLRNVEQYAGLSDTLAPTTSRECCDAQARLHHVLPVMGLPDPTRDHYHDLHIRYYFGQLPPLGQHRLVTEVDRQVHEVWRLAASVHFEPEPEHPGHPYIDECPICGVVAPYDLAGDRCEKCHDPLGLELLFFGTIRGQSVLRADGHPVGGLKTMAAQYDIHLSVLEPPNADMNTLRVGTILILPCGQKGGEGAEDPPALPNGPQ